MDIGSHYNWKNDPDTRLEYLGYNFSGDGRWHQFSLEGDERKKVWCEITDREIPLIEPCSSEKTIVN